MEKEIVWELKFISQICLKIWDSLFMFRIVFCWISWTACSSFEWKHFSCIELNWAEMYTKSNLTFIDFCSVSLYVSYWVALFLPSSLHRICMRKFDFIDFLLWNPDEQDFYSYQKFNINLDWRQNHYEVESVFETNLKEMFYQISQVRL